MDGVDLIGGQRLAVGEPRQQCDVPRTTAAVDVDAGFAVLESGNPAGHRLKSAGKLRRVGEPLGMKTKKDDVGQHALMLPRGMLRLAPRATDTVGVPTALPPRPEDFRDQAATYARIRPGYPPALFERLRAWVGPVAAPAILDVGAGSGQASRDLATWPGATVVAIDPEPAMLRAWPADPAVRSVVAAAEALPFREETFDLVVAAQAAHWFHFPIFCEEALRVLRPEGVVAIWTYGLVEVDPAVDAIVRRLHDVTLAADWEPGRRHVVEGYRDLRLPLPDLASAALSLERRWTLDDLGAYLSTWSGLARHRRRTGQDPLPAVLGELAGAWGTGSRDVRWPLTLRAVRKPR